MNGQTIHISTLYADICDSVRLYEKVGDAEAHRLADGCMQTLVEITGRHAGTVIRTQGDGVMSTFPSAAQACDAAWEMQEAFSTGPVAIKIGFNHGAAIPKDGDVYGDAVNLAARIMGLARAGEILTTWETVQELTQAQKFTARMLDRTMVKGKSEPVSVYSLVNAMDAQATVFSGIRSHSADLVQRRSLTLEYRGRELSLGHPLTRISIGRADTCQLVVDSGYASRVHGIIELKNDSFVYTDQSTNGTYLRRGEGEDTYLKRESVRLLGSGVLSLGVSPESDESNVIRYRHQNSAPA
jgi:adenylate cyclase